MKLKKIRLFGKIVAINVDHVVKVEPYDENDAEITTSDGRSLITTFTFEETLKHLQEE